MNSRSITTEVSRIPLARRCSGRGLEAWVGDCLEIATHLFQVDTRGTVKMSGDEMGTDETLTTIGTQLSHGLSRASR